MSSSSPSGFLIRDGLESDIPACLQIDHRYQTDFVWQMTVEELTGQRQITFKTQRLPRTLETEYAASTERLMAALPRENCFLVAVAKGSDEIMGYMAMQVNRVHQAATIHDLVVSQPYRHHRIGSRLVGIARQWAKEHGLIHLMTECQTQNYPAISFCQQVGFKFCGYNDQYFPNQDIAVFFSQML